MEDLQLHQNDQNLPIFLMRFCLSTLSLSVTFDCHLMIDVNEDVESLYEKIAASREIIWWAI